MANYLNESFEEGQKVVLLLEEAHVNDRTSALKVKVFFNMLDHFFNHLKNEVRASFTF